jgi:TonB family protein
MASTLAVSAGNPSSDEPKLLPMVVASLVAHIVVFVGIPLLTTMIYRSQRYERPRTFQLVSPSLIKTPVAPIPHPQSAPAPKKTATTPVPKNPHAKPTPKKAAQEENTNDLNELLEAVQSTKVSEIVPTQNFKYNWFLQNIRSKIDDQWKPPMGLTEKKDAAVVVTFTILQNGSISGVSIANPSGVSTLDNLAMRATQLAAPFGKLPIGFSENKLDITYTFYYEKK